MQLGSVACQRCGTALPAGASDCPQCGAPAPLGNLHEASTVAVSRPRPPRRSRKPWATIVAVAGTALIAAATLSWLATRPDSEPVSTVPSEAPIIAAPAASPEPRPFDPDAALDEARAEARRWNADAALAGMEIGPFINGKPSPDAKLRAEFGKPAGAQVGPGAGLGREALVVVVTKDGTKSSTKTTGGGVGVAEPNCIVEDVWRKALPAGVDAQASLRLRYELNPRDNRSVWKILGETSAMPLRVVDGINCSFLVR